MMRVKKLASLVGAVVGVGTLATVIGLSAFPAAGQTGDPVVGRSEAPGQGDSRRSGEDPKPITIAKTYYIGDLASANPPHAVLTTRYGIMRPVNPQSDDDRARSRTEPKARPAPDTTPVIELIATTIAPGSWRITDLQGKDLAPPST